MTRKLLAEFLGSALLAALVIGSGIAAHQLSPTDTGLQLLENAAATAAGLFAIILMFGPVSGGHFNPVVSLVDAVLGGTPWRHALAYVPVQIAGCAAGAVLANVMFDLAPVSIATTQRATTAHGVAEIVATVGLLLVIFSLARTGRAAIAPAAVGAYIGAAYFFTSSPPASPTQPSRSGACSATPSPASHPPRCRCSWPCSSSAAWRRYCSCAGSTRSPYRRRRVATVVIRLMVWQYSGPGRSPTCLSPATDGAVDACSNVRADRARCPARPQFFAVDVSRIPPCGLVRQRR